MIPSIEADTHPAHVIEQNCPMSHPVPPTLKDLVQQYDGREQPSAAYKVQAWKPTLTPWPKLIDVLEDDQYTKPHDKGDRYVGRADLARLFGELDLTDGTAVLRAFVLVMVWGSGKTNSRTRRYLSKTLDDGRCVDQLVTAAERCRRGEFESAYAGFSLPGIRRSYFTKWFAFAGRTPDRDVQPLILDDRVLRTLNALNITTAELAGSRLWRVRYVAYVQHLHAWSRELHNMGVDCSPERLEWILYAHPDR